MIEGYGMERSLQLTAAAIASISVASAHPHDGTEGDWGHDHNSGWVHENGIGPDLDRDTNPATDTRVLPFVGEVLTGADGTVFPVIHFEPPPGRHGETIKSDYYGKYGVKFGPGLTWQICEGQRHFQYNSMCTYEAPTSGDFAAGYLSYLNYPLVIEFDQPVCLVSMSIYPTGGEQDELFEFVIEGWYADDQYIDRASEDFRWKKETVRFRNIAGAYFMNQPAKRIAASMRSIDETQRRKNSKDKNDDNRADTLRYLIDDLAFVSGSCEAAIDEVDERTDVQLRSRIYRLNRDETAE
jgi:hypothetical protein